MDNTDKLIKQTNKYLRELKKRAEKEKIECSTCGGKGYFLDSTYDRTGVNVKCGVCYSTGLPTKKVNKIIIKAFKKYVKELPE